MKKHISAFLSLIMALSSVAVCYAEELKANLISNGGERIKSGYTLTVELSGVSEADFVSAVYECADTEDGEYSTILSDSSSDMDLKLDDSLSEKYIRANVTTKKGSVVSNAVKCGANISQPLSWNTAAPNAAATSPAENKFVLTDGTTTTKELILLSGQEDKAFILAPSTGPLAFYADSTAQFQIIDTTDPKSIFYKINQDDYINQNVLPISMQEYLLETGWETEAGYKSSEETNSNMQNDTVTYSKVAILSQNEYYDNADKIGYTDAVGLTLRSPCVDKSCKIQVVRPTGKLEFVNTYSSYYSTLPCFYMDSCIFKRYKLISAGANVRKFLNDMYSIPELLEIGYTKEELVNLGFSTDYPIIENVRLTGNNTAGSTLTPVFDYSNTGDVPEGENIYEWYRIELNGEVTRLDETSKNYTVSADDIDCQIYCVVTPYDTNKTRGFKEASALSDKILSTGKSIAFDEITLNQDGTAKITFNFDSMNQENIIAILEVFDGYKLVESQMKETDQNETVELSTKNTAGNAYAKAFVVDKDTNKVYVALTKNFERKPIAEVKDESYSIKYNSNNEVYVLSGVNSSVNAFAVYVKIKKANEQEPIFKTCEFVKDGKILLYFNMPVSELSGEYTVEICSNELTEPIVLDFYYSSIRNKSNILEMLNNAKTIQEYSIIISQKLRELEISDKYLLSMDNNGFEFIGTSLIGNEYSVDTIKNFYDDMAVYSACYNLSSLKTGKEVLDCAEYYQDKIKLTENKLYADFLSLNNENKVNVFSLFKGRQIHDLFELNNVFEDSVILTIINSSESYGMLHNCLLKYESYLPFSLSEYKACDTTKISRYLFKINTGFKTMDELKDRIAEAVRESKKETNDYGSGSGSGSGSSSSPIKKIEVTNTETKEPINTVSMFNDVPKSHWAYENILALQKNRIVNGNEKNLFEPEKNITREEFVKIVDIVLNVLDENAECDFDDVDKNAWYYKYVASAKKLGIVDGIENNKFGVGEFITREDMAVIISRAYNLESETDSSFNDESLISDYAKSPVAALANAKIIDGFEDGTFRPKAFATRAEAAKIIYCLIK